MNVYVESNFMLDLASLQEQHAPCENIFRLCERGSARLVIPVYSLIEPYKIRDGPSRGPFDSIAGERSRGQRYTV